MFHLVELCFFLVISGIVIFSNFHDWDQHLSFALFDYKSYLQDFELPLWSYQHCGGISRIGDPQALGLSPLIIFVLLFGPFWGLKFISCMLFAIGYWAVKKNLNYLFKDQIKTQNDEIFLRVLSIGLLCSNFFIWHIVVGHINFLNIFVGLALVGLLFKSLESKPSYKVLLLVSLCSWQYFSAFLYVSNTFVVLPIFLTFALFLKPTWKQVKQKQLLPNICRFGLFFLGGLLLASYKFIGALSYNLQYPRSLEQIESYSPITILEQLLIPTNNYQFLFREKVNHLFGVHELSAFSIIPLMLLGLLLLNWKTLLRKLNVSLFFKFTLTWTVICFLFSLGHYFEFTPFALLNKILGGSVRSAARYQIGMLSGLSLLTAMFYFSCEKKIGAKFFAGMLTVIMLNFFTFADFLSYEVFKRYSVSDYKKDFKVTSIVNLNLPMEWPYHIASHYHHYLKGVAIRDCYNPLIKSRAGREGVVEIVVSDKSSNTSCHDSSYFTQNHFQNDQKCQDVICLNLESINPSDPPIALCQD